jgi:hypothetical protein
MLQFTLPLEGNVSLTVHDILGREVRTLLHENLPAGDHAVRFNGEGLSTGVYFYRLSLGSAVITRKMVLLK